MRKLILVCGPVLVFACVSMAHAGVVDKLRAALTQMHANKPIAATVNLRGKSTQGDQKAADVAPAKARIQVRDAGGQLSVTYPAKLLKRLDAESAAHAKDSSAKQPIQTLLDGFGPLDARSLVDFAPGLERRLADATLQSKKQTTYAGKSVHLLVFKVPLHMSSKQRDNLDDYKGQLKVWVGSDGVPVAVSEARSFKFSKFFISFHMHASMSAALQQVGQRLVAVTWQSHSSGSGLGQDSSQTTHATVHVKALRPAAESSVVGRVEPQAKPDISAKHDMSGWWSQHDLPLRWPRRLPWDRHRHVAGIRAA